MYSLIKFYFKLPDAKLNVKMVPSVLYPLAWMETFPYPVETHVKAVRTMTSPRGNNRGGAGWQSLWHGSSLSALAQWRQEQEPSLSMGQSIS